MIFPFLFKEYCYFDQQPIDLLVIAIRRLCRLIIYKCSYIHNLTISMYNYRKIYTCAYNLSGDGVGKEAKAY